MGQFITFYIENMLIGIDIGVVDEINKIKKYTTIPSCPDFIKGLINLRGQIVTIFDFRKCIGIKTKDNNSENSCNIILKRFDGVNITFENNKFSKDIMGFLVDKLGNIENVNDDKISLPPANIGNINFNYILKVAELDNELMIIPDIAKILVDNLNEVDLEKRRT